MKFELYKNFIYAKYGLNFNVPAGAAFFLSGNGDADFVFSKKKIVVSELSI